MRFRARAASGRGGRCACGAGGGPGAERGAAGGSRLPARAARRPGPGPAPVTVAALALLARRPRPHGPVPPAARPPRRLRRPQLCGRLLHLPRLDRGVQAAGDRGHGGARRYPGTRGGGRGGGLGVPAEGGAVCCSRRLPAGGASPGAGAGAGSCLPKTAGGQLGPGACGADARPSPTRPASAVCTKLPRRRPGCRVTASSPRAGFTATLLATPTPTRLCPRISAPRAPLAWWLGEAEEE